MAAAAVCGAKTRSGGACQRPAGWGTSHQGHGQCKLHYGNTPNGIQHAERLQVEAEAAAIGLPASLPFPDLLEGCIARARAMVAAIESQMQQVEPEDLVGPAVTTVERTADGDGEGSYSQRTEAPPVPNAWLEVYGKWLDRLAGYLKLAKDVDLGERQTRVAEQYGGVIAAALIAGFDAAGVPADRHQDAIAAAERMLQLAEHGSDRHLQLVEGTATEDPAA